MYLGIIDAMGTFFINIRSLRYSKCSAVFLEFEMGTKRSVPYDNAGPINLPKIFHVTYQSHTTG